MMPMTPEPEAAEPSTDAPARSHRLSADILHELGETLAGIPERLAEFGEESVLRDETDTYRQYYQPTLCAAAAWLTVRLGEALARDGHFGDELDVPTFMREGR